MARILKPWFRSRHHRKDPNWDLGTPPRGTRRRKPAGTDVNKPGRSLGGAWRIDWQVVSLVAIVFVASFVWVLPALEQSGGVGGLLKSVRDTPLRRGWSSPIQVVDGDTVRSGGKIYRLVGFNTPEAGRLARCGEERTLAAQAAARLRDLVDGSETALTRVSCACPPGTEGTPECNHGRLCGTLTADGRDVGRILIAEGLAEPYRCWGSSCPRRRDWCQG